MLGVDPGEAVIDFCRARGLPVLHGTIEEAKLAPSSFDAVVIWNTFDQLPDPHSTLMSIVRVLRSGGLCVIRVPNGACFEGAMRILPQLPSWLRWPLQAALAWNNMLTFPYLYGYSPDTLARLTAAYGFRVVACIPDTIVPVPAHQLKPWAGLEERCYQWLCRLGWQAARREGFRTPLRPAPWLDFYLERAATDDELPHTESAGLGLIPVYEPLAFNQTSNRSQT
jgi:SAM-dependent methyltransferase